MGEIYVLENKENCKKYVGQTKNKASKRIRKHARLAEKGEGFAISCAIKKYGLNSFKIEIFNVPNDLLDFFEKSLIEKYNCMSPNGYNLESGGKKNKFMSEESKRKISLASLGHTLSEETKKILSEKKIRENNPMYGKQHSDEVKEKMSDSQKERWDDDLKQHYSEMYEGDKNPFFGKKHSEETINKIREKCTGENSVHYGKHRSQEIKDKISKKHKGKKLSEKTKNKIGEANKGHTAWNKGREWDSEMRKKISDATPKKYQIGDVWYNSKGALMYKRSDGKRKRVNLKNIPEEIKEKVDKITK